MQEKPTQPQLKAVKILRFYAYFHSKQKYNQSNNTEDYVHCKQPTTSFWKY